MRQLSEILLHNGIYLGVTFVLALIVTLIITSVVLRLSNMFLRSKTLALSDQTREGFRNRVRRIAMFLLTLVSLGLIGGTLLATWRHIRIGDFVRGGLARMQLQDWLKLGIASAKTVGVIILAFLAARILVALLNHLRERLQHAESLAAHRERMGELLIRLRLAMSSTLTFGTLILCAQLLGLPEGALRFLWGIAFIGIAFYVGRFAVGAAHLAIDVLFELSDVLSRLENPLRYLSRFRHLSKLTKGTVDYFIYVGLATWVIDEITPSTWASQAGRLAIRIIAIFYISRVLVEVCVLFMNEFFLTRDQQSDAEYQQRQTLVPVAAGLLRYGIYFAAIVMILREAGIDPTPLLAGAGVLGVAIGLGAQAFVGDIVAGFFILFENLLLVGDYVEVAGVKGKVEEIGVRVTRIRDEAGVLHALPNGEVRKVSSHSRGYCNVIIDIPIPYGENLHQIFDALNQKTVELRAEHAAIMNLTEFGLEDMKEATLLLRSVTMVKPGTDSEMSAVLRLAFWEALTAAGIEAPMARRMMIQPKQGEAASATKSSIESRLQARRSDIQRLKAANLYGSFDIDRNGYLERFDVDKLCKRIIEGLGRQASAQLQGEVQRRLLDYWNDLVRFLDRNKDGRVSREEFLQFCAKLGRDPSDESDKTIQALADVLFIIVDRDGAGTISEKEFIGWTRAYGIVESAASAGFRLIDNDGNGLITRDEWNQFVRDIFQSQKMNDATAIVFGPGARS